MLQGCCCFSGGISADRDKRSSEVQIQYDEVDVQAEPIGKSGSSTNNGESPCKEKEQQEEPGQHPPLHAVPSCPALTSSYEQRSARPASTSSTTNKAQNNSTREGSAPAAEDGRAATASSLGSHSRGTSLRRNLARAESATPSRGGGGMLDRAGSSIVTKTHSFKRIMSFRTGGSGSRRSHNSVEFVQGNLTAGTANGSVRPMQFGFLGQIYRRTSLTGSKFLRRMSSRTGGFNGGATDCEAEDGEEDLANGDPFAEGEKLQ